jgi:hypothetical protein
MIFVSNMLLKYNYFSIPIASIINFKRSVIYLINTRIINQVLIINLTFYLAKKHNIFEIFAVTQIKLRKFYYYYYYYFNLKNQDLISINTKITGIYTKLYKN